MCPKMSIVPRLFGITSLNKDTKRSHTKLYILIHKLGKELGLELSTSIFQCYHKLSGLKSAHLLSQIFCESGVQAQFKQVFYKVEITVPPRDVLILECSTGKDPFSKLMWSLAAVSTLCAAKLGPQFFANCCSQPLFHGHLCRQLITWQLFFSKPEGNIFSQDRHYSYR